MKVEKFKSSIKYFVFIFKGQGLISKYSFGIKRLVKRDKVLNLLRVLLPKKMDSNLIRIGINGDGGYLIPDILTDSFFCISIGCNNEWSFERDLFSKYNVRSVIVDEVTKQPADLFPELFYIPKFLGRRTSRKYVSFDGINKFLEFNAIKSQSIILKIDIEGDEYAVLPTIKNEFLKKVKIIVIELHNLELIQYQKFYDYFNNLQKNLFSKYSCVHLHPNNCCGVWGWGGVKFPRVAELTFVRGDIVECSPELAKIPNRVDFKNVLGIDDIQITVPHWPV